jgi:hypothetical protein
MLTAGAEAFLRGELEEFLLMKRYIIGLFALLLLAGCTATATPAPSAGPTAAPTAARPQPPATEEPGALAQPQSRAEMLARVPALAEREARFQQRWPAISRSCCCKGR